MNPGFRFRYALRSLTRAGQRSLLAVLCIGFGVLSLVAMQLLAETVRSGIVIDPRLAIGGDLRIAPANGTIDPGARTQLARWEQQGVIRAISLQSPSSATLIRRAEGGRLRFLSAALGVDSAFPLVGAVAGLSRAGLVRALAEPGTVLLTADVARALEVSVGDRVAVGSLEGAPPVRLQVAGIVRQLPDHRAGVMLFGAATAASLRAEPRAAAVITAPGVDATIFRDAGWQVRTPADAAREAARVADLFDAALKGAGLLGLLVGALGVLNTLHVALARRTQELATLKTLGYTARDLIVLLGLEVLLLGVAGAVLGAGAGVAVAAGLAALLDDVQGSLSIVFRPDPMLIAGGCAVGLLLSVSAGMLAAVRVSTVRPALLLRQAALPLDRRTRTLLIGLASLLLALFTAVAAAIMDSVPRALGVVALAVVVGGLVLAALAVALWSALRLPLPLGRFGAMARRNLRHRPSRSLFALAALAVGVFTIGFAAAALLSSRQELIARQGRTLGDGLLITADAAAAADVERALVTHGLTAVRDTSRAGWQWRVQLPSGTSTTTLADGLGRALPEAMVISTGDLAELLTRTIFTLFTFVAAIAALALLAGAVLIANAVGLGLLERRRELAMLKALGYSQAQVLRVVLLENGMLGLIGSLFGLLGTFTAATIFNSTLPQANLQLHLPGSVVLVLVGTALCAGTALAVAWPATRVRPLFVLREE